MDRDSMAEAYRTLMRRQLSQYAPIFEGKLQGTLNKIARSPKVFGLAGELVGGLERVYTYSKLKFSSTDKERLREVESNMLEVSPLTMKDNIEKILRGDVIANSFFTDTINVLDTLEIFSISGFMRNLSLVEHMAFHEFLGEISYEVERLASEVINRLYVHYRLDPDDPLRTTKAILLIVKQQLREGLERKLSEESYLHPLEEDRLIRLLGNVIDVAIAIDINDLKRMVSDSLVSLGYRREELDPEIIEILTYIVKDLLAEISRHREEIVARSLEGAGSKLIPKLSYGLVQDHAFYSFFASKIIALAPDDREEYMAIKRSILKGLWGYEPRHDTEWLINLSGQDIQFSVYLNAMRRNLIKMLERLYGDENIDIETKSKIKLLQAEVLDHYGSLSRILTEEAGCGRSVKLTRLESTRAWLTALVSSMPALLDLAEELTGAITRRGKGGLLIARVNEEYVKEVLLPGVVSIAPLAAYYFDVMEAPTLHREDRVCVMRTLMREMVTEMSYREVAMLAERLREIIEADGASGKRR